jgi:UDP-N-acetylglucosamine:LPS N-acetylglucosamine transferase
MQFAEEAGVALVRESVEDIALASLELVRSPHRLRKMKDNCKRVMNEFDPRLIARQLHDAFRRTA